MFSNSGMRIRCCPSTCEVPTWRRENRLSVVRGLAALSSTSMASQRAPHLNRALVSRRRRQRFETFHSYRSVELAVDLGLANCSANAAQKFATKLKRIRAPRRDDDLDGDAAHAAEPDAPAPRFGAIS
jgi:hypothetical protein